MQMKTKILLAMLLIIALFGCDENTGSLGLGVLPDDDRMTVGTKTFDATTKSVLSGPVFAKTSKGYIGRFTDPEFGYYEAGFLTQLHSSDSLEFPAVYDRETKTGRMTGDSIHSVELTLFYNSYFGDSLNACRMSVYELDGILDKNHYTDINPADYYSESDLLARKAYTAVDLSVDEADRYGGSYYPYVGITLPREIGDRIYRASREHPEYFYDAEAFIKNVFKGLYIKSDYGDGTVLYVDEVALSVSYPVFALDTLNNIIKTDAGADSINYYYRSFVSTKEVIQANQFVNSEKVEEKAKETDWSYIKSPAGIFTQVTLPIQQIADELASDTLNAVKLELTTYAQESEYEFSMSPPTSLLLVREKEFKSFFEENKLYDGKMSFLGSFGTNKYVFDNISRLVSTCVSEKKQAQKEAGSSWDEQAWEEENKWDKVLLVPVVINRDANSEIISIHNDMKPSYVKIKGGEKDIIKVDVTYTSFK